MAVFGPLRVLPSRFCTTVHLLDSCPTTIIYLFLFFSWFEALLWFFILTGNHLLKNSPCNYIIIILKQILILSFCSTYFLLFQIYVLALLMCVRRVLPNNLLKFILQFTLETQSLLNFEELQLEQRGGKGSEFAEYHL